jgi:hypothetical protein
MKNIIIFCLLIKTKPADQWKNIGEDTIWIKSPPPFFLKKKRGLAGTAFIIKNINNFEEKKPFANQSKMPSKMLSKMPKGGQILTNPPLLWAGTSGYVSFW